MLDWIWPTSFSTAYGRSVAPQGDRATPEEKRGSRVRKKRNRTSDPSQPKGQPERGIRLDGADLRDGRKVVRSGCCRIDKVNS
jgi:hypothetical protein